MPGRFDRTQQHWDVHSVTREQPQVFSADHHGRISADKLDAAGKGHRKGVAALLNAVE